MDATTKRKIQRYEQTRIVNLMSEIEEFTNGKMFHEVYPQLQQEYEQEISDHTETRSKISRFRCRLENLLTDLQNNDPLLKALQS